MEIVSEQVQAWRWRCRRCGEDGNWWLDQDAAERFAIDHERHLCAKLPVDPS